MTDKKNISDKEYVTYEDFGAVGDGVTNDFEAMYNAHIYANENSKKIKALPNRTYLIKECGRRTIPVKTSCDFCGSTVVIDDRDITYTDPDGKLCVMQILSDKESITLDSDAIERINQGGRIIAEEAKKFDTGLGVGGLLDIINRDKKVYIRYGGDANDGSPQSEVILVDKDGNIDKDTPFLIDYDKVSAVNFYPTDDEPLYFENAKFVTRATCVKVDRIAYIHRGISVTRSNTVIRNIEHTVTDEPPLQSGAYASYSGFLCINHSNNVLVERVAFTARLYYKLCGSYDFSVSHSNKITFKDCTQTNFFMPDGVTTSMHGGYWGVMGSNFSKNITYDGCKLTRYDAHCGVYNGKIINSEVAHFSVIGGGHLLIENTKFYGTSAIITLRPDYGCTFKGDIVLKNCTVMNSPALDTMSLISAVWVNHYFGYKTYVPSVTVENLKSANPLSIDVFKSYEYAPWHSLLTTIGAENPVLPDGSINENPMSPPDEINIYSTDNSIRFSMKKDIPFLSRTKTHGIELL